MKQFIFTMISKAMNAFLHLDPESSHRLAQLEGKAITLTLQPMNIDIPLYFNQNAVLLNADETIIPEAHITGTPLRLMSVVLEKNERQRFFAEDIVITGNAETAQAVISLFDKLNIDWEEYLAEITGDVAAHHTGNIVRNIKKWFQKVDQTLSLDMNEYLHEEKQWFPTKETLADFFAEIDTLRMDVDRIEVKLKRMLQTLAEDEDIK